MYVTFIQSQKSAGCLDTAEVTIFTGSSPEENNVSRIHDSNPDTFPFILLIIYFKCDPLQKGEEVAGKLQDD